MELTVVVWAKVTYLAVKGTVTNQPTAWNRTVLVKLLVPQLVTFRKVYGS